MFAITSILHPESAKKWKPCLLTFEFRSYVSNISKENLSFNHPAPSPNNPNVESAPFLQRANCLSDCLWYRLRTIYFASINHHKHHKGHSARIEIIWNYRGYFFNRVRDCLGSNAKAFHEKLLQKRGVLNCVFWTSFHSILGHHRTPIKVLAILHFAVVDYQPPAAV